LDLSALRPAARHILGTGRLESRALPNFLKDGELMPQGEDLEVQGGA
jgi:hypothetical protein